MMATFVIFIFFSSGIFFKDSRL